MIRRPLKALQSPENQGFRDLWSRCQVWFLATLVIASACASPIATDASAASPDTGATDVVAQLTDIAATADVYADGTDPDAPSPDTGSPDTGSPDTGSPDASSPDTSSPDASSLDAADTTSSGDGSPTCPTAVVSVKEGAKVTPSTVLHLRGDKSHAADGGLVTTYQWSVTKPSWAVQRLVPAVSSSNPHFTAHVAGTYTFCLRVWDAQGAESCKPACTTVEVIPTAAIHVELTWHTPANPTPWKTGPQAGADFDLHFAHPLATSADIDCDGEPDPWFSNPFDTFWFNPNPNWGSVNPSVPDDPSLYREDTDGAGPELLELDDPEGTLSAPTAYAIGVQYWNAHGFGVSTPTVRVYIFGTLTATLKGPTMKALDFWYVGKLRWPNSVGDKASNLAPIETCHQSVSPCSKTKPGKMWTATGDHCIRPCYVNPAFVATQSGASQSGCTP